MKIIWLIFVLLPQQLTWYEHFEQGERQFRRGEYEACLASMEAALAEKPQPGRNVITRAVQQIEYKPFYYQALCHYRLGNLFKAFEYAQKAYNAEVVRNSPILQSDLAAILEDYRSLVLELNREYEQEAAYIEQRREMLTLLTNGEYATLEQRLTAVEGDVRFEDIRLNYRLQQQYQTELSDLQNDIVQSIQDWIDQGDPDKARALLSDFANNLHAETISRLQTQLDNLPPPEPDPVIVTPESSENEREDPVAEKPENTAETTEEIKDYLDDLDRFKEQVADLQNQRSSMNRRLSDAESRNLQLQKELEQQRNKPAFEPRILVKVSRLEGTRIAVDGRIVTPFGIKRWYLQLNGEIVALPETAMVRNGNDYTLTGTLDPGDYGRHEVRLSIWDELAGPVRETQAILIPAPFYRNPRAWLWLAGLLLLATFAGIIRYFYRRRQAKLRHFNPYIAGSPVRIAGMFYGRDELLHRVQNLVHKNSFMIHGERRIGKTSLLFQLKANLANLNSPDYRFYPVFIDLQGVLEKDLFHHMMADVLHAAEDWPMPLADFTFRDADQRYQSRHFSKDMKQLITQLKKVDERHPMVVLLVDEVDCLNEFSEKTNQKLRGIFMKDFAEHLTCVMAGIHLKREWESSGSPWYNFFEEIPLEPFDEQFARQLITRPVRGTFRYRSEAVERILDRTGRHPYLIQKVCVSLIGKKLAENRFLITLEDVETVLHNMKEEMQGVKRHELHD